MKRTGKREDIKKVEEMQEATRQIALKYWKALSKRKGRVVVAHVRGTHNAQVEVLPKGSTIMERPDDLGIGVHVFVFPNGKTDTVIVTD